MEKALIIKSCALMSAMALHIMAMIFQVAKLTTFPLSVNKIYTDHLIYEAQDIHKVFKNIKLLKNGSNVYCVYHNFLSGFAPSTRLNVPKSDSYRCLRGVFLGSSYRRESLNVCFSDLNRLSNFVDVPISS